MDATCQFAVYPLGTDHLPPPIDAALAAVRARGLETEVRSMATVVAGDVGTVVTAPADAFRAAADGGCVLVATVSNACPASQEDAR